MQAGFSVVTEKEMSLGGFRLFDEGETTALGLIDKINLFADKVHGVLLVDVDADAVDNVRKVGLLLFVESYHQRHATASSPLNSNAKPIILRDALCSHDVMDFAAGAGRNTHGANVIKHVA
jgi:hypothetical protein